MISEISRFKAISSKLDDVAFAICSSRAVLDANQLVILLCTPLNQELMQPVASKSPRFTRLFKTESGHKDLGQLVKLEDVFLFLLSSPGSRKPHRLARLGVFGMTSHACFSASAAKLDAFSVDESSYSRLYSCAQTAEDWDALTTTPDSPTYQRSRNPSTNVRSTTTGFGFSRASEPSGVQIIAARTCKKHYGSVSGGPNTGEIVIVGDLGTPSHDTRRPYKCERILPHQWVWGLKPTERCLLEPKLEREPT